MKKSLTISKLDAAKRQLETYIRLYFNSGDPVAMHTLSAAAYGVIRDLNKQRCGDATIQEKLFERVKPEHHKLLREKLSEAQNFFKHADRDHTATLEFNPDLSEIVSMDACSKYRELTGEVPPLFLIFHGWMMITHPEIFELPEEQRDRVWDAARTFVPTGKSAYFVDMLPVVMRDV